MLQPFVYFNVRKAGGSSDIEYFHKATNKNANKDLVVAYRGWSRIDLQAVSS